MSQKMFSFWRIGVFLGIALTFLSVQAYGIFDRKISPDIHSVDMDGNGRVIYVSAERKSINLSPDRKYLAYSFHDADERVLTSILDLDGKEIIPPHYGNFKAWAIDSKKVALFLSERVSSSGRSIYYLDLNGNYYDSGLPRGIFDVDISTDGSIAYSLTDSQSNKSALYVRKAGQIDDQKIFDGNGDMIAWIKWSPLGDKIIFKRSDLYLRPGKQSIWTVDAGGKNPTEISNVDWINRSVNSPVNNSFSFINQGNIFEYNLTNNKVEKLTENTGKSIKYINYKESTDDIVFSDGEQIYMVKNKKVIQITNGGNVKYYPVIL